MTWRNSRTGAAVSARSTGPLNLTPERRADIDINALAQSEYRERKVCRG
jgi:hypothetical protein